MKILPFLLLFALLKGPVIVDPPIKTHEDLMKRIEEKFIGFRSPLYGWMEPQKLAVVDWVTPEYRPVVIEYLKNKAKDPKYQERAQRVLIALDDDDTVSQAIHQFNDGLLKPASILWQNLKVDRIKDLIPVIYEGSETPQKMDIGRTKSPRYYAVDFSLSLIAGSEMFAHDTSVWASGLRSNSYNYGQDPQIMWLFQQWWEHNKTAILAGKYSEATWLPLYKGKPDDFSSNFRNEPEYRNHTALTRNDILHIPKTADIAVPTALKSAPKQVASPKESPNTVTPDRLPLYVGIGVLIAAFFGWLIVRRSKARV